MGDKGTPEKPFYWKFLQDSDSATKFYAISVDEGWRSRILCSDMYERHADWLVDQLQGRPLPE